MRLGVPTGHARLLHGESRLTPRERAARKVIEILDSPFLQALAERARLEVLRVLLLHGASDVGQIASHLPQDRSVISRHLATLEEAGIVQCTKDGRRRIYRLDGVGFVTTFERILAETRAIVPACCPA
jgi:DNA-binding transcriptional ArsR family regulator